MSQAICHTSTSTSTLDLDNLESLSRRELQAAAKEVGIPANKKSKHIIDTLREHYASDVESVSTTQPHPQEAADDTTVAATSKTTSTSATSIIPTTPIGLNYLPLELLADMADIVHDYRFLLSLMLVSKHLYDGVSLSKRWRIVYEVLADVEDVEERRKILFDRAELVLHACHAGRVPLLRYIKMTREEAYSLCLSLSCLHGHLKCVRYLMAEFDIKDKVLCPNLLPRQTVNGSSMTTVGLSKKDRAFYDSPFEIACRSPDGFLLVKYFHEGCHVSPIPSTAVHAAACSGSLDTLQYLRTTVGLTADDARVTPSHDNWRYSLPALHQACLRGDLPVVQYLVTGFGLTADDARADDNGALRWSCHSGHLPVVRYLHEEFRLTADDARSNDNSALLWSCENGHLPVVQYLHSVFGLTADDARADNNYALQLSCENGHLPVVQNLHTAFGLTADDARANDNYALLATCERGRLPVVQYLHTAFGLTADDTRAEDNHALRWSCENGHLPVVQYLHTAFGLTADDARAKDNHALESACENGHLPVVLYLRTAFGLTTDNTLMSAT